LWEKEQPKNNLRIVFEVCGEIQDAGYAKFPLKDYRVGFYLQMTTKNIYI